MKYILVDASNTFFRGRHVASKGTDQWTKLGFALHLTIASVHKAIRDFSGDHVIICLESRSWRKDFYEPYKRNRAVARQEMSESEAEEDKLFYETYDAMNTFFHDKTACSVIKAPHAEADDIIARWIALHPNDEHVIVSSDSDFHQLISDKVTQFNGVTNEHTTLDGVFNDKGKPVKNKKTGEQKTIGDPKFVLFEKCMRGDPTDNIFSAYPGVRTKGSKNKVGLTEAFQDMDKRGYNWNNMMLQRWSDHNGDEHRVLDDYFRNVALVDLNAQPQEVKDGIDDVIRHTVNINVPSQIGTQFLKFCGKYDLVKMSEQANSYAEWMKKEYKGSLLNVTTG